MNHENETCEGCRAFDQEFYDCSMVVAGSTSADPFQQSLAEYRRAKAKASDEG